MDTMIKRLMRKGAEQIVKQCEYHRVAIQQAIDARLRQQKLQQQAQQQQQQAQQAPAVELPHHQKQPSKERAFAKSVAAQQQQTSGAAQTQHRRYGSPRKLSREVADVHYNMVPPPPPPPHDGHAHYDSRLLETGLSLLGDGPQAADEFVNHSHYGSTLHAKEPGHLLQQHYAQLSSSELGRVAPVTYGDSGGLVAPHPVGVVVGGVGGAALEGGAAHLLPPPPPHLPSLSTVSQQHDYHQATGTATTAAAAAAAMFAEADVHGSYFPPPPHTHPPPPPFQSYPHSTVGATGAYDSFTETRNNMLPLQFSEGVFQDLEETFV